MTTIEVTSGMLGHPVCRVCGSTGVLGEMFRDYEIYAFGSEGVLLCGACQITLSEFVRAMAGAAGRAKMSMARAHKVTEEARERMPATPIGWAVYKVDVSDIECVAHGAATGIRAARSAIGRSVQASLRAIPSQADWSRLIRSMYYTIVNDREGGRVEEEGSVGELPLADAGDSGILDAVGGRGRCGSP